MQRRIYEEIRYLEIPMMHTRGTNKQTKKFNFTTMVPQVKLFSFVFWGVYYSKMADSGPRTYCNAFCMIWGTSEILSKSGPADLPIITKRLQKIQENMGASLQNIVISDNLKILKFSIFERYRHHVFICFRLFLNNEYLFVMLYFVKMRIRT